MSKWKWLPYSNPVVKKSKRDMISHINFKVKSKYSTNDHHLKILHNFYKPTSGLGINGNFLIYSV